MRNVTRILRPWLIGTAVLLAAARCAPQPTAELEPFFPAGPSQATAVLRAQDARGARLDGTLHAQHFDGTELNSLGRERLSLMLQEPEAPLPLTVWMDLPDNAPATAARRAAVQAYLREAGLTVAQIKVENGCNPASTHATAGDIAKLEKLESGKEPAAAAVTIPVMPTPGAKQ